MKIDIDWDSLVSACITGVIIVIFASVVTFGIFFGVYKVGVKFQSSEKGSCQCTCVKEG